MFACIPVPYVRGQIDVLIDVMHYATGNRNKNKCPIDRNKL